MDLRGPHAGRRTPALRLRAPRRAPRRRARRPAHEPTPTGPAGPPTSASTRPTRRSPWSRPTVGGCSRLPSTSPTPADPRCAPIRRARCSGCGRRRENRGARTGQRAGSWNFSELNVHEPGGAERFYGAVFGWVSDLLEMSAGQKAWMWRVPGYGEFLAERDPEIRSRQEADQAPGGFADAVALMNPIATDGRRGLGLLERHVRRRRRRRTSSGEPSSSGRRSSRRCSTRTTPAWARSRTRRAPVFTVSEYRPPSGS